MLWECQESKDGWTRSVVSTSPRGFCQERELGEMYIEVLRVPWPYVGELGGEGELGEEGRKETRELAFFPSFSFLPTRLVHPSRPINPTSTRLTPLFANPSTLQPSLNASLTPPSRLQILNPSASSTASSSTDEPHKSIAHKFPYLQAKTGDLAGNSERIGAFIKVSLVA